MRMTAVLAAAVGMLAISSLRAADAPPQYYDQQVPQEQIVYQDCVTHSCRLVPETKQIVVAPRPVPERTKAARDKGVVMLIGER